MRHSTAALALLLAGCGTSAPDPRRAALGPDAPLERRMAVADAALGARSFGRCAQCHTIGQGGGDLAGPNLHAVFGRAVAASARFGYTDALRSHGGVWDAATLDRWLANPAKAVPGTSMAFPGIADPIERADLIAWLRTRR